MAPTDKPPTPEREQTDESLRVERRKADDVLADKLTAIEEAADAVIEKARARADEVLAAERAKVDRQAATPGAGTPASKALQTERGLEDRVLRKERADADEVLRLERVRGAALLATERDETDKDLSRERSHADDAVATRDEFLGIVSHDLRNLLGVVIGFATLIAKAESGEMEHHTEQVLTHARRIQRSGARMNRLIGDLVDVASIEAGALAVRLQLVDPVQVVTEAVDTFQAQALANGLSLVAEVVAAPSLVELDPARILQVLANLVGNAIKFTPPGGSIVVQVQLAEEGLQFAVRDTGVGIPADYLETVFERFRQVVRGDGRGVGLGLYISKCIVQGHGGRIWAESRPGEGSSFSFTLPVQTHGDPLPPM
jgi:signal transduction histidine kinase